MSQADDKTLSAIYRLLHSQALPARRVGYEDSLQQALYFEVLTAMGMSPTSSVLDVGCGRGDLYAYLQTRGFQGHYVGLDIMPHLIEDAQARFPHISFLHGDIVSTDLEPCDYALASGLFDYYIPNCQEKWKKAIQRMFALARRGIAWNGLLAIPEGYKGLWAQPLPLVLELCASLGDYYSIRCDYDPLHFTAFVYKREHFYSDELLGLIGYLYLHPEYVKKLQNNPLGCSEQFSVTLQQLNIIAALWEIN